MPAMMKLNATAGPAFAAACCPASTKMPTPMIPPRPIAVSCHTPSTRRKSRREPSSACRASTDLWRVSWANRLMLTPLPVSGGSYRAASDFAHLQRHLLLAAAQPLRTHFAETEARMEFVRYRIGRIDVEFAVHACGMRSRGENENLLVQLNPESAAARGSGDDNAVNVQKLRVMRAEPAVIRAVVVRAFAERKQERGDGAFDFHDTVIRGLRVQMAQAQGVHRTGEMHRSVVQREDRGEILRGGVADHGILIRLGEAAATHVEW